MSSLVDRRLWSNMLQLTAVCVCAVIGAIYAYRIPPNTNWLAAFIGAIPGIIAVALVTGAILAFMPAAHSHRRGDTADYVRLVRQSASAIKIDFIAVPGIPATPSQAPFGFSESSVLWPLRQKCGNISRHP